jgi:2-haloacid dehalogenase
VSTAQAVKAVLFDVFGTVVDWRTGVAAAVRRFAGEHGLELDADAFADAWRSRYVPGMRRVSTGERPFVPLDVLHRENLDGVLEDLGLDPGRFGPAGSTNSTAPGTSCRPGPTASRGSPR